MFGNFVQAATHKSFTAARRHHLHHSIRPSACSSLSRQRSSHRCWFRWYRCCTYRGSSCRRVTSLPPRKRSSLDHWSVSSVTSHQRSSHRPVSVKLTKGYLDFAHFKPKNTRHQRSERGLSVE